MSVPATVSDASDTTRLLRLWVYGAIITVAVTIQFVRIASVTKLYNPREKWPKTPVHSPLLSANDRSRWCTVWSLAERGTFQIDEIIRQPGWNTIDKVLKDGHFYSSKPPMLTVGVAGVYWTLKRITGQNLLTHPHGVVQSILVLINLLPFAISMVLFSRLVERYSTQDLTRVFVMFAAGFATFLSTFLTTFNNHTVAANCVLWAMCPALRVLADRERRWYWFGLAGLFAALAVTNELPAAIFLAGLGVLLLRADWKLSLLAFLPAALIPIATHFGLTLIQTGGLKPFYAGFGTEIYNFPGSYWLNPQGIDRNLDPPWLYFIHCTVGHHGIFSLSPIFLLTLWSWTRRPNTIAIDLRAMHYLGMVCTVAVVGFYMTRTSQYNFGGVTSGLRWTFWLTPLWLWSMIPVLDRGLSAAWLRRVCLGFLAVSVFSATFPWNNPWTHPWLFQVLDQAGWIDYDSPLPQSGVPPLARPRTD